MASEAQKKLVVVLRAAGAPPEGIARELSISVSTLELYYKAELNNGRSAIVNRIAGKLIQRALQGHFPSQAYYLSRFGGPEWRQTSRHELTGADGLALTPPDLVVNFIEATNDDRGRLSPPLILHPGGSG